MRTRLGSLIALALVVAGCGGAHKPAYSYQLPLSTRSDVFSRGISIVVRSPAPLPAAYLTASHAKRVASFPKGPSICSGTMPIAGGTGRDAALNGKTLKVKVYGPAKATALLFCAALLHHLPYSIRTPAR